MKSPGISEILISNVSVDNTSTNPINKEVDYPFFNHTDCSFGQSSSLSGLVAVLSANIRISLFENSLDKFVTNKKLLQF